MSVERINIGNFTQDSSFYNELLLLITIKSFDLQAIRNRYLKSKNKASRRVGSTERREVTEGGVASLKISKGKVIEENVLTKLPEPRGIDIFKNIIAISSENKVFVFVDNKKYIITDPWFSYIHTVSINYAEPNKILVSSSGFDSVFEYDYIKNEKTFEWFAWENGFNTGKDPETGEAFYLTRRGSEAEVYKKENKPFIFIENPEANELPTSKRAAFINSVAYDPQNSNRFVATFFHEGAIFLIDKNTNEIIKTIEGLTNPHGGRKLMAELYLATSTKSGEVVIKNKSLEKRFDFSQLKNKPETLGKFEWIQNSVVIGENIISIDSNRNAFVVFNPELKLYDTIAFNQNWAVQDIVIIEDEVDLFQVTK